MEYEKNTHGGFFAMKECGLLMISGSDALSLINRMSTNDLSELGSGNKTCLTVLTTEKAKIIDIVTLLHVDAKYLAVTSANNQQKVKAWLEKFVIMEDVQISDVTPEYKVYDLYGTNMLININPNVDYSHLLLGNTYYRDITLNYYLYRDIRWSTPVYSLILDKEQILLREEETSQVRSDLFEILRVEEGIPLYGKELTEDINPLEAGLQQFISFTKGCYIGQEVIARVCTYKRLQKKLRGFIFDVHDENLLKRGKLYCSNDEAGFTTSHAWSPKLQKYIALGYIKTNAEFENIEFRNSLTSSPILAKMTKVPFCARS